MSDPTCSCCAGVTSATPVRIVNRPGLTAIARRVGTHATFKESIIAGLSGGAVPALAGLGARSDDDVTIALADGFAIIADVLTFYQERIANEAYLRTATERRSVLELARLIGYRLAPGLAAETWLAFTLDEARTPGAPPPRPITIDTGTRVQSIPGQDETAQTFETIAPIEARPEWSALRLQNRRVQPIHRGQRDLVLDGVDHQLSAGDEILIVGDERANDTKSTQWDVRLLVTVAIDQDAGVTRVTWRDGLEGAGNDGPAATNARVYAFRQRAAIFGHNAPDPRLLKLPDGNGLVSSTDTSLWLGFGLGESPIDLDQTYPKVVPESWVALLSEFVAKPALYRATTVAHRSVSDFALASRVTRVGLDTNAGLKSFGRRDTLVLCQSDELPMAQKPVRVPVFGSSLAFESRVPGLVAGAPLAVSGPAQHLRVAPFNGPAPSLALDDGTASELAAGDRLTLLAPPDADDGRNGRIPVDPVSIEEALDGLAPVGAEAVLRWRLEDRDGRAGTVDAPASALRLDAALAATPADPGDPVFSEVVSIADLDAVVDDRDRTTVALASPLTRVYDRAGVRINANVARATHGETVSETLGGGDSARPNQRFRLQQSPLTYVGADTPSGSRSTLTLRVDGTKWEERQTLFGAGRNDRAYISEIADDASAEAVTGDGNEGARVPTGQANVRATYRKGIGAQGNVRKGQLTTLLLRPLGVNGVVNPEAATGGEDPEVLAHSRENAPLTVLTLDRAVSRLDYADFARAFSGIAKADSVWIPTGPHRGVAITVAGTDGVRVIEGSKLHDRLVAALRKSGDPLLRLRVLPHEARTFRLGLDVKVDEREEAPVVLAALKGALSAAFAFDARSFGQPVSIDEVAAIAHGVRGVVAIDITALRRSDGPAQPEVDPRLDAAVTSVGAAELIAAELLTLDEASLDVREMP
jgi:hypothetical protein